MAIRAVRGRCSIRRCDCWCCGPVCSWGMRSCVLRLSEVGRSHQRAYPAPCPQGCTSHARWCPQRHGGGLVEADVKSKAGRRCIARPDELFTLIMEHRKVQDSERELARHRVARGWLDIRPAHLQADRPAS
jgi:hypothetical protein